MHVRGILLAAALSFCVAGAAAQALDQTDLTFWQSIQSSQDPAEYQAYLTAFPKGIFADLARLRLQQLKGGATPAAAPDAPAQAEDGQADDQAQDDQPLSEASLTVSPARPRVGNHIMVTFADMPTPGAYDKVVIVAAGSPDKVGTSNSDGVLANTYIANQYTLDNGWDAGVLAPGAYQVRWLTTLYNNENRLEVGARSDFKVSR